MRRSGWALVVVGLLLAGCSSSDDASPDEPASGSSELTITGPTGVVPVDEVVALEIAGAPAGAPVEVEVTSTDDAGIAWASTTELEADADGRVPLGDEPMAPFTTLVPVDHGLDLAYAWGPEEGRFAVTVRAEGRDPAEVEVRRRVVADGLELVDTDLAVDGFVGHLWTPAPGTELGSAVLLIGGSGGGRAGPVDAAALASRGVAALEIAYFKAPGLPDALAEIPLETFVVALEWLAARPGVDPERVWVTGASRGSEAAVLVAGHHPDLVAGVVALVPSDVAFCSPGDRDHPAWTEGGVPVACDPPSPLPVEAVDGPVIAVCGGDDDLWASCPQAERLLDRRGTVDGDHLVSDPDAGHSVGLMTPYAYPHGRASADALPQGGGTLPDDRVRAAAWPLILEALGAEAP